MHDFTATPSISTVQAPHWLVSQPILVPVRPGIAQEVDEQQPRLDLLVVGTAVDADRDGALHEMPPNRRLVCGE